LYTLDEVSKLLGVVPEVLSDCVTKCRTRLSPECRKRRARRFTEGDLLLLARALVSSEESHTLVVQCAWCGRDMGIRPGHGVGGISHGLCPACSAKVMEDYQRFSAVHRVPALP
jgi:hypothetical protein